jgi:hypothetical protein
MSTQNKTKSYKFPWPIFWIGLFIIVITLKTVISSMSDYSIGDDYWTTPTTNHSASSADVWMRSEIYIAGGNGTIRDRMLFSTLDHKLIILGSEHASQPPGVIAFDSQSGNRLWRVDSKGFSISSMGSVVFVGSAAEVIALDGSTGQRLWRTFVFTNVRQFELKDNLLYATGTSRDYILDPETGKIIHGLEVPSPIGLEPLSGIEYYQNDAGDVISFSHENGQEVWRKNAQVISNLAVTPTYLYALSLEGDLLRLEALTGQSERIVQFSPAPFRWDDNYYVEVDQEAGLLFVYLGDSRQLFAFKIK